MIIKNVDKIVGRSILNGNQKWIVEGYDVLGDGNYTFWLKSTVSRVSFASNPPRVVDKEVKMWVELHRIKDEHDGKVCSMTCQKTIVLVHIDNIKTIDGMLNQIKIILPKNPN